MISDKEWSIRSRIADLQVFLTSEACSPEALDEINAQLDGVMDVVNRSKVEETGGKRCASS